MQDRTMVTFVSGQTRFTYRVAAIIVRGDHVLLMRNLAEDYWFVPGGRAEIGESAAKALAREITEETRRYGTSGTADLDKREFLPHRRYVPS
jgi:8-oxo-dGTP pyrophosphatase MutT (NUDIX family)